MHTELIGMLLEPEQHIFTWRDGELFVRRMAPAPEARSPQARSKDRTAASRAYKTRGPEALPHRAAQAPEASRQPGMHER